MKSLVNFLVYFFMLGNFMFSMNKKHLLVMLLMLEYLGMIVFMILYMSLMMMNYNLYFLMLFLIMMVCESVLGLSVLVNMIRIYGNDYFKVFSIL
uniref:NADH-ubiquinone oxidoreductase chain 4L n=1 Tax=Beraea pullata TaxID=177796 RepID=A0A7G7CEL5_9NEOP|nr:NADH dehydrogenase subunit 4L [Beraea pullata]